MYKLLIVFIFCTTHTLGQSRKYVFVNTTQDTVVIHYSVKGDTSFFHTKLYLKQQNRNTITWNKNFRIIKAGREPMVYLETVNNLTVRYTARNPNYFNQTTKYKDRKKSPYNKQTVYQRMIELQNAFTDLGKLSKDCLTIHQVQKSFYHSSKLRIDFDYNFGPVALELTLEPDLVIDNQNYKYQLISVDGNLADVYTNSFCNQLIIKQQ